MLGLLSLLLLVVTSAIWFRAMRQVRIPSNRTPFVLGWVGAALLGLAALSRGPGFPAAAASVFSVLGGTFFTVLVAISRQQPAPDAIRVGASLPDFTAPDMHDANFELSSVAGRPVLLKFFRGHW